MKKSLLLLPLLAVTASAAAQTNFQPGYIVQLSGDTLRGEVDSRGAQRSALSTRFRPAPAAASTEYQPAELRGYGFKGGKEYVSMPLPATTETQLPLFLERLVNGQAQLYYQRDPEGIEHFYVRLANGPVRELIQQTRLVTNAEGRQYRATDNAYQRTLQQVLLNCPAVQQKVERVGFGPGALSQLVAQYNACQAAASGGGGVQPVPAYRGKVRISLLGGAENAWMLIDNQDQAQFTLSDAGSAAGGVGLQYVSPFLTSKLAFRLEGLYSAHQFRAARAAAPAGIPATQEFRARQQVIRVPLLVRYTFPKGMLRPFVQAGIMGGFARQFEQEYRYVYTTSLPATEWRPISENPRRTEQGVVGSIGFTCGRPTGRNLALELRAERTNGFSNSVGISLKNTRANLLISYDLTR